MFHKLCRAFLVGMVPLAGMAADWAPQRAALMTRWANEVSPENVHPEYPRPQMVREKWVNLNGLWDYAIVAPIAPAQPRGNQPQGADSRIEWSAKPDQWDGQILVPFPVESALSGVMRRVPDHGILWYRRAFAIPEMPEGGRLLLHFGACDWETVVWVNGKKVGEHRGGYDPFTFDITDALIPYQPTDVVDPAGGQELVVAVSDPTDGSFQPRGKQVRNPRGIWYTPTTGIWQTVWLEPVPKTYIRSVKLTPHIDEDAVEVDLSVEGAADAKDAQYVFRAAWGRPQAKAELRYSRSLELGGTKIDLTPAVRAMWWTPEAPNLIDFTLELESGGQVIDSVSGYFGMRSISLGKDEHGVNRIMLNNTPLFQYGPLDQGFWPDGLYTAPTDEALRYDIELTRELGFNMIRKHVKVEPARWYYWCDKLGMLVWQDMPSGDRHAPWNPTGGHNGEEIQRSPASAENFDREWRAIIDALRNHPCIVMWVPFNEAWGQFDTVRVTNWTKEYDPTRLVNCASGGNDFPVGDVLDIHRYPGPAAPTPDGKRAIVLGEFGGLGLPLEGHTWLDKGNWGYRSFTSKEALTEAYLGLLTRLRPLIHEPGLSAAVYTQTTDVEVEVNGLMTYDRAVIKLPAEKIAAANRRLYLPPPRLETVVPSSRTAPQRWRFTTDAPPSGWEQAGFDDSAWAEANGGFGTEGTPGTTVRQTWNTPDIWLRRTFELPADRAWSGLHLDLHHDEDAEIYLNGVLAARVTGYTTDYGLVPIREEALRALRAGRNVIAIHCHQTGGGQYIDAGLVDLIEQAAGDTGRTR